MPACQCGLTVAAPGYRATVSTGQTDQSQPRVLADRYELLEVLGTGGMATVWAARDHRLGRTVAVKVLRDDLSEEHAHRIEREARAAARIVHRRVITVLDLEHDADGAPFLVMEALEGTTLADRLCDGPLPLDDAQQLAEDLLGGLAAAHEVGVLHRDVKPSNLLACDDGWCVTDFGIASLDDEGATKGDLMGTLVYLAPERFDGAPASPRTDVFSAAAVLYEALSGRQPFRGEDAPDSLHNLRTGRFAPLPDHVPPHLASAVAMGLDPDPQRRPADAGAFARMVSGGPLPETEPIETDVTEPIAPITPDGPPTERVPDDVLGEPVAPSPTAERTTVLERPVLPTGAPPDRATDDAVAPPGPARSPWADRGRQLVHEAMRRPQLVFGAVGVLLLIALLVAAAAGGDDAGPSAGTDPGPAVSLDQQLDRIAELGR